MKKAKIRIAFIIGLAVTILAGQAIAGPGGGGRGRGAGQGWIGGGARGGGQGWGREMAGGPRTGANRESVLPDNFRGPGGQYCPYCQRPARNIRGRQGRGPGGFGQGFQGRDQAMQGRGGRGFQGRGQAMQGRGGRGFQGRGQAIQGRGGRGFQGRGQAMQGRGGRGFQDRGQAMQGRGGRGLPGRGIASQGRGMSGRRGQPGPGGVNRPGSGIQPRRFAPEDTDQTGRPMRRRGQDWIPGMGRTRRQGMGPGWGVAPQQPEKAPDIDTPAEPVPKDLAEKPQDE